MKHLIFILLLSFFEISVFALQPMVRNFTHANYDGGTQNWAIAQDESNSMFFANNSGLLVFNGSNWNTYPIQNRTNVRSILHSKDGRLYASSYHEFGYYEKMRDGGFTYHSLLEKMDQNPIKSNEIFNILEGDNKIYFQAEQSVSEYDGKKIKSFQLKSKIDASAFIQNDLFVASAEKGVFMLKGKSFVQIPGSEILINKRISSILPFKNNKILFVTSFEGVFLFDGRTIVPFKTGIDGFLKTNQVFCATSNAKQLVFGTVQRGIAILNIDDGSYSFVNTYSGLQNNTILSVAFDNQQNLWLGLDNGIDYVMLNTPIRNVFGANNLYGAGYTSLFKNNIMYFGTNQGLYSATAASLNNQSSVQLKLIKGMEGQVWCLSDIDNTVFCGNDQGTFIIYPNHVERISNLKGTWNLKQLRHHPDLILGSSYKGLFILKKVNSKWIFSHYIKGNFTEESSMFEESDNETFWFSHWQKGVFHLQFNSALDSITKVDLYDMQKGFPTNRFNTFFRIGNEIIFSSENGIYSYNEESDRMELYNKWNKMFSTIPRYIRLHESKNGDVWCASGHFVGLAKKNPNNSFTMDSLTYRILQIKIIPGFEHFNFIDSNQLILSTENGFCWIDIKNKINTKNTFKVFVSRIIITNNMGSERGPIKCVEGDKNPIEFSHHNNSLRFEFVAPEYRNEGLIQYSYMLENHDEKWSDFKFDNIKEYTKLPRGNYIFKVRARNLLESKEASCNYYFTILPAWYESLLAFVIYGILLLAIIIVLMIWINNRSRKGARDMEMKKELEIIEHKKMFETETAEKKREIKDLKNQQLQYDLRHKAQELASSTMNLIRKNEVLLEIKDNLSKMYAEIKINNNANSVLTRLNKMNRYIIENIGNDNNWKRFEENFDLVYENYLKRMSEMYPNLSNRDKKLLAYLKMGLSSKDIAPLLNITVRSVEMNRHRLRSKMGIERDVNLGEYLQNHK